MPNHFCYTAVRVAILVSVSAATASHAQNFTTLANFNGSNGAFPYYVSLVQGVDGAFYGTTEAGVTQGTVFKITSGGTLTNLHSFNSTDGAFPYAGLALGNDGNFYGLTANGGASITCSFGCGTVFRMAHAAVDGERV